jgi:predicted secreted hydrolase
MLGAMCLVLAGVGSWTAQAQDFQPARPGRVFEFPRDHGAHPDFKTEWWYYSGHLTATDGERFGYQLTFFRVGLPHRGEKGLSAWRAEQVYFAHVAVSAINATKFYFREHAARGALGLAGAATDRLSVWVDRWRAEAKGEEHHLEAAKDGLGLSLVLNPEKPPVLHGSDGYSLKAAGTPMASHYYSITRMATRGRLILPERTVEVSGSSWFDREFSTSHLAPHQVGWDWFALQLNDGSDLMLYVLRLDDGSLDPASSGTWVGPQGQTRHLKLADVQLKTTRTWKSPHSGATYPAAWDLAIPSLGYRLTLTPTLADQELRTGGQSSLIYWEGQVQVQGSKHGDPCSGLGYAELTGYAGSMGGRF